MARDSRFHGTVSQIYFIYSLRRVSDFGHQLQQQQQQPKLQQQQHRVQKLYKALYDYTATQKDELRYLRDF